MTTNVPLTNVDAMQRLGYAPVAMDVTGVRIEDGCAEAVLETLADETPVALAYNLAPHAVMMATPADLEDFAVGFSVTEGIVRQPSDITRVTVIRHSRGVELQMEIPATLAAEAAARSRRLSGRTGCGICGASSIDDVLRELPTVAGGARIEAAAVTRAMRELAEHQPLNAATGAVHAAAWARGDGTLAYVREDVGRHNALDKLVGAVIRAGEPAGEGFVVITSRGSFELVQKAAILGVPLLAAVSAPTALAVRVAHTVGLTLAGFARDDRVTAYTHSARLQY
jgi:FdhD protein